MVARALSVSAIALSSLLGLSACSSSGGVGAPAPIQTPLGAVAPEKNLIVSDLSVGTIGNQINRDVDQTFDLVVTTKTLNPDINGSSGLLLSTSERQTFGEGSTLEYDADTNTFSFDIQTEGGNFNRQFQDVLLADPTEDGGMPHSDTAKLYLSDANGFQAFLESLVTLPDLSGLTQRQAIAAINNFLVDLEESGTEENTNTILTIQARVDALISFDQYVYWYTYSGGDGYLETTNTNGETTRRTDTVAIGSIYEFDDDGEERVAHFVFGTRTPLPEMPTTGSADYTGKIVGTVLTNNAVDSLTGTADISVDFVTNLMDARFATTIREGGGQDGGTTFLDYKTMTGTGIISDTTFDGTLTEVGGNATGEFEGGFYGPIANEVGGTFTFGDDASFATGAFTGRQLEDDDDN